MKKEVQTRGKEKRGGRRRERKDEGRRRGRERRIDEGRVRVGVWTELKQCDRSIDDLYTNSNHNIPTIHYQ